MRPGNTRCVNGHWEPRSQTRGSPASLEGAAPPGRGPVRGVVHDVRRRRGTLRVRAGPHGRGRTARRSGVGRGRDPGRLLRAMRGLPSSRGTAGANHLLVGPMEPDELRRAIRLPAERVGLTVEPELVDALVAEVTDEPGGLPLLSTTLLGCAVRARTLTFASYRETAASGAVARLAEDAVPPAHRSTARRRPRDPPPLGRPGHGCRGGAPPRAARRAGREERSRTSQMPRDPHGCAAHGHRDDGRGR